MDEKELKDIKFTNLDEKKFSLGWCTTMKSPCPSMICGIIYGKKGYKELWENCYKTMRNGANNG